VSDLKVDGIIASTTGDSDDPTWPTWVMTDGMIFFT